MLYLLPLEDDEDPPPSGAWRLFSVCEDQDGEQCAFFDTAEALEGDLAADFDALLTLVRKLAATGKPWETLVQDRKELHDLGDASFELPSGKQGEEKIWQFRKGQVRILWCYGGGRKVMILAHVAVKKSQKTPKAEIDAAEAVMKSYFSARELNELKIIGDENGRALHQLFAEKTGKPGIQKAGKTRRDRR